VKVAFVALLFLLLPASPAMATCELGESPDLGPGIVEAAEDAQAVLGAQLAGYWLKDGWDMGVAPGPLTVETARSAIGERLAARFPPEDAERLMSTLQLHEMPYSDAELDPLVDQLDGDLRAALGDRIFWVVGVGCLDGEAWRVEVGLYADATADDIAEVREILEPHGDKVRLYLDGLVTPPNAGGGSVASRLRSFVRVRCVGSRRISVRTRPSARAVIRRVTVRGRRLTGTRRVVRGRKVRVVVKVGNGERLAHTYHRC
jgi:hypothetical protein